MATEGTGAFRCPRCGNVTTQSMDFCPDCGQSLNVDCHQCGTVYRYYRVPTFCPPCGAQLVGHKATQSRDITAA